MSPRVRAIVIPIAAGLASALVAGLTGYGIAYSEAEGRVDAARQHALDEAQAHEAEQNALQASLEEAVAARTEAVTRAQLLEANRTLHNALLELDAHNFGSAQRGLEQAAERIRAAAPGATAVFEPIDATELEISSDVAGQRAEILNHLRRLDEHLGLAAAPEPSVPPAPEQDSAVDSAPEDDATENGSNPGQGP